MHCELCVCVSSATVAVPLQKPPFRATGTLVPSGPLYSGVWTPELKEPQTILRQPPILAQPLLRKLFRCHNHTREDHQLHTRHSVHLPHCKHLGNTVLEPISTTAHKQTRRVFRVLPLLRLAPAVRSTHELQDQAIQSKLKPPPLNHHT